MTDQAASQPKSQALQLIISWTVVGIPLIWGIWTTAVKLPALFR
jgi:hypothetical protein